LIFYYLIDDKLTNLNFDNKNVIIQKELKIISN